MEAALVFRRALKALQSMVFGRGTWYAWRLPRTRFDYQREVGTGLGSSVVMAPVLWIARTFPEAPPVVYRRKGGELDLVPDHAMIRLLKRPTPFHSGPVLWMATMISWTLDGNAYWLKVRDSRLAVRELWYTPHWLMEPKWPEDGSQYISHYEYTPGGGEPIRIDPEDVVHFRYGIDPTNTRKGLSPLKSLFREIFTDDEAANFSASLLRNMGVPGVVVSPEKETLAGGDDVQATKSWFKEKFGGDNRGEPLVMSGPTKVQQFGFSPKELDLSALREIPEERVTAVLGIPAAVVGFGTGLQQTKVGATMKELREQAYESNIIPTQRLMAAELDAQLLPEFEPRPDQFEVGFDLSKVRVLQDDQDKLAERAARLFESALITRAAGKRMIGEEPDASDEVYLVPMSRIEVPVGSTTAEALGLVGAEKRRGTKALDTTIPEDARRLVVAFLRDEIRLAGVWTNELTPLFEDLGKRAAEAFERVMEPALAMAGRNGHTKALPEDMLDSEPVGVLERDHQDGREAPGPVQVLLIAERVFGEMDLPVWTRERFAPAYAVQYERVIEATVGTINSVVGVAVNLPDPVQRKIIARGGRRVGLVDLAGQTKESLFRALSEGRAAGEGPRELARRIRDEIPRGPWRDARTRASVIARTETKYAQNISSLEAYKASDSITAIRVVDAQRGPTDDFCEAVNGLVVSFEDADWLADEEHPNGTRSFTPVVGDAQPQPLPAV